MGIVLMAVTLVGFIIYLLFVTDSDPDSDEPTGIEGTAPISVRRWVDEADAAADFYGLDTDVILAIIWQESAGDPDAEGSAGEIGLMQVTAIAAEDVGMRDVWERGLATQPTEQIEMGAAYFEKCLNHYNGGGSRFDALRCYNEGPPPYTTEASRNYAAQVTAKIRAIKGE